MDQSGLIGLKWIEMDKIGQNRTELDRMRARWTEMDWIRPNRIECTDVDQKGFMGTEVDRIRTNWQIRTKVDIMDQIGTNKTK